MEKTGYVLSYYGNAVAIIIADETELKEKVATAIKEEVCAETDAQFELTIGRMGDWGEDVRLATRYVNDGSLVEDNEFKLTKLVTY